MRGWGSGAQAWLGHLEADMEAVTHGQGGLEAGTRAVVGVDVPWDAHRPFPKANPPGQGGGRRSVPGTLAGSRQCRFGFPRAERQVPEVTGGAASVDRGLLGRRGSGGRGQERAWAPWGNLAPR